MGFLMFVILEGELKKEQGLQCESVCVHTTREL